MKRTLISLAVASATALATIGVTTLAGAQTKPAPKISDDVVKIGLLLDMSSLYADLTGEGSVHAVRMAVEDFGGKVHGKPIEIVFADHQNKADIAGQQGTRVVRRPTRSTCSADVAASATALAAQSKSPRTRARSS